MENPAPNTPTSDPPLRLRSVTCRAPFRSASLTIREALALSPAKARLWILGLDLPDFDLFARQILYWADRGRA